MNIVPAVQMSSFLVPTSMNEAMKLADMMASCSLVPRDLQKKPADCLMVIMQAIRWQMDPFAVAQECSVIQGKLMHQGKLVAAVVNARGNLVQRLQYTYTGEGDDRTITVSGKLHGETKPREVSVILRNAKTNNAQWIKQPDQQLAYHGTRVWARRHTPELMLGVNSPEEFDEQDETEVDAKHNDDAPELTKEWFDSAELHVGGVKVEPPAKRLGRDLEPYKIAAHAEWRPWAEELIAHIRNAETLDEVDGWLDANDNALLDMREVDPKKYNNFMSAVELHRKAIGGNNG